MNFRVPLLCVLLLQSAGIAAAQRLEGVSLICPADIFPSDLITKAEWFRQMKNADPNWIGPKIAPFGISLNRSPGNSAVAVFFEVSCPKFMETWSLGGSLEPGRTLTPVGAPSTGYGMSPPIVWKKAALYAVKEPEPEVIVFRVLGPNGAELWRDQRIVMIHSMNECVTLVHPVPDSDMKTDYRANIATYVNESHPEIAAILKEAIDRGFVPRFLGQRAVTPDIAMAEMGAVWKVLQSRKLRFGPLARVSSRVGNLTTQNTRFIDDTLRDGQANCMDGSVLIASIFMSIGVDCNLVFYPDHCQVAVRYPNQAWVTIETAELGKGSDIFAAIYAGNVRFGAAASRFTNQSWDFFWVDVSRARKIGVMPLQTRRQMGLDSSGQIPGVVLSSFNDIDPDLPVSHPTAPTPPSERMFQNGVRATADFPDGMHLFPSELIGADASISGGEKRDTSGNGNEADPFQFSAATSDRTREKAVIIRITCTDNIMEPSELRGTLTENLQRFSPKILWRKDTLQSVRGLREATITFSILDVDARQVLWTERKSVRFHSLNECVIQKYDYSTQTMKDVKANIVGYVSEEAHDLIGEIKRSALKTGLVERFRGPAVSDADDAMKEIDAIWTALQSSDLKYDTIARTSTDTALRKTQNVRFIDETWNQRLANCVDASVLLASIFLNMGVDCKLVLYPGHCQVMVEYPKVRAADPKADPWVIETTLLGSKEPAAEVGSKASFSAALAAGKTRYDSSRTRFDSTEGYHIIDVREARKTILQLRPLSAAESR